MDGGAGILVWGFVGLVFLIVALTQEAPKKRKR